MPGLQSQWQQHPAAAGPAAVLGPWRPAPYRAIPCCHQCQPQTSHAMQLSTRVCGQTRLRCAQTAQVGGQRTCSFLFPGLFLGRDAHHITSCHTHRESPVFTAYLFPEPSCQGSPDLTCSLLLCLLLLSTVCTNLPPVPSMSVLQNWSCATNGSVTTCFVLCQSASQNLNTTIVCNATQDPFTWTSTNTYCAGEYVNQLAY